jgi:hypothetical protein
LEPEVYVSNNYLEYIAGQWKKIPQFESLKLILEISCNEKLINSKAYHTVWAGAQNNKMNKQTARVIDKYFSFI